jgi:Asp-tRNA(Asn)/Glu-tRNA(Gln) amidotransferase A subunit family amidase
VNCNARRRSERRQRRCAAHWICLLAVGTDAALDPHPAAFCGVRLKPTFGKVAGLSGLVSGDVAHVGPMSRTVEDAALMFDAMKGPDRDWHSLPDDASPIASGFVTARRK